MGGWSGTFSWPPPISLPSIYHKASPDSDNFGFRKLTPPNASLIAQLVKNTPAMQESPVQFLGQEVPWRRDRLPTAVFLGFPGSSAGKESACDAAGLGLFLGWEAPLKKGKATHSSILAWRIPWLHSPWDRKESDTTERLSLTHSRLLFHHMCSYFPY